MARDVRHRGPLLPLLVALGLLGAGPPGRPGGDWPAGRAFSIPVRGGSCRFRVPTPSSTDRVMVIISTLDPGPGSYRGWLKVKPSLGSTSPPEAEPDPVLAPAPVELPPPEPPMPVGSPPSSRVFHVLSRGGDVALKSSYEPVPSTLRALGRRVQIYVDDLDRVEASTLRDLVETFDRHVYPVSAREIGAAADVDGDGRFTMLLTARLARLGGGRLAAEGCVRGADLDPDVGPPLGNRCDMMYLNARKIGRAHV